MIEARHGRRIPSGRRLARVLADVLRSMLPHARAAVRAGRVPSLAGYEAVLIRALLPILLHEWQLGREQIRREVKSVRRLRKKAAFPFGGNAPEGLISVVFGSDALPDAVPRAVQQAILALAGSITDSTRQAIRDRLEIGLREGESNADIADRLTDLFSPQRAYTIAASEASRAMHGGEAEQAREYGAAGMEWIASSDACELCLPLDGKRVRFGEPFVTLTHGNPAYRIVTHPPAHPRCECSTSPWWDDQHEPPLAGRTAGGQVVRFAPHPNQRADETTVMIDPRKFDAAWSADPAAVKPGGAGATPGKLEGVAAHLASGKPVAAPRVALGADDSPDVIDGRHRLRVLTDAGVDRIAVTVPRRQAGRFRDLFG